MPDLNTMLLDTARNSLQSALDAAVTNGDTEAARKAADELGKLAVSTAPKAPLYGHEEIKTAMEAKADWFGIDPKKSGRAVELGKNMSPKRFATAEAFADAVIKAVDEEFKPAIKEPEENDEEVEDPENEEVESPKPAAKKRSDGPADGDTAGGGRTRRTSGPWTKISDAPADVQKEIKRTADKFAPKTEDGRKNFIAKALEAHYTKAQLAKGRK